MMDNQTQEKKWYEIELKKEAKDLLKAEQTDQMTKNIIDELFTFNRKDSYESNLHRIGSVLKYTIGVENAANLIGAFENKIKEVNDRKYGSDSFYEKHQFEREFASQEPWAYHFGKLLAKCGLKEGDSVLDVGVNDGEEIESFNYKTTGIDLSPKAIAKAKQKFPNLELIVGSANEIPFKDKTFDAYISLRTLCVTGIYETKAISEAERVLKKGGKIIISLPNTMYDKGATLKVSSYNLNECSREDLLESGKKFYDLLTKSFADIICYKNGVEDFICAKKV